MKRRVIKSVRFTQALSLGTGYVPKTGFRQGEDFDSGYKVWLDFEDHNFMKLTYQRTEKDVYHQLVPWACVASVIYAEVEDESPQKFSKS